MTLVRRTLELTGERLRAYSRRGNFHSDPETARELGLTGLVAQGLQVIGPAYGVLLDEWDEEFLAHGELEVKFVRMVTEDQTVEATVDAHGDAASFEVTVVAPESVAAVGRASRRAVGWGGTPAPSSSTPDRPAH
jgi:hypothetical protein